MTDNPNPTNATASEPGAAAGAADPADLSALLAEFDDNAKPQPTTPTTQQTTRTSPRAVLSDLAPVIQYAKDSMLEKQRATRESAVGEAIASLKGRDELKIVPDPFLRGFLVDRAGQNPDFDKAFREQSSNPTAWKKALGEAVDDAAALFKGAPDQKVTETLAAARAAVAGDVSTVPDDKKAERDRILNMGSGEFRRYKESLAG